MKRLCFLLPDIDHARQVVNELEDSGIAESRIHLLANKETPLEELPGPGYDQNDFFPALERGLAAGAAVGLVAGLIALRLAGGVLGGAAVLLISFEGAMVGGWLAALAGSAFPSSRLKKFEDAIESGQVLIMIDVEPDQVDQMTDLVRRHHPEAKIEGFEPHTPVIP